MMYLNAFKQMVDYNNKLDDLFKDEKDADLVMCSLCCFLNFVISSMENPEKTKEEIIQKLKGMPL